MHELAVKRIKKITIVLWKERNKKKTDERLILFVDLNASFGWLQVQPPQKWTANRHRSISTLHIINVSLYFNFFFLFYCFIIIAYIYLSLFFRSLSFFVIFHYLLKFFYICGGKYMAIGHNGVYARQEEYIIIICMIFLEYKLHASVSVCSSLEIFPVRFVLVCAICVRCSLLLDVCLSIWCFPLRFNDYNSPLQYVLSIAASPIFSNYVISMKVCSAHTMHLRVFPVALNQVESSVMQF